MSEKEIAFQALVLQGLWTIMKLTQRTHPDAVRWRADAIWHMDLIGQQTEDAKKYRREVTFAV